MQAFNKQVNAAIVDPGFIVSVRKKLDLGQREGAEIFGGGINAFSRYENGKTKPPPAWNPAADMSRRNFLGFRLTPPYRFATCWHG